MYTQQSARISQVVHDILRACRRAAAAAPAGTLLLASLHANAQGVPAEPATPSTAPSLQEILVTAQRRTESTYDVPYNITAVDSAAIQASGAATLSDLTRVVPGLTTVDQGGAAPGRTNYFTLRGLQTDTPGGGR